jgi:MFS family permease
MASRPIEQSQKSWGSNLHSAWLVVALLAPVALLNYFDRQMLTTMKSSVTGDIPGVGSNAHWGIMLGQFKWVYAILSPFGGYIADRFSRKWTICVSLFSWSAITWLTGHANSYPELLWTRVAMGVSECAYIPAGLALITDYHMGATRSRAVGFHQAGIYLGILLGGSSGYIADAPSLGWRFAFDAAGIFGILYALLLAFTLRDVVREPQPVTVSKTKGRVFELLSNLSFVLLVFYFTIPALSGWVVRDWMPSLLKEQFGITQGQAGVAATLSTNIASLATVFAGCYLADQWVKRNLRGRIFISAIGMALVVPAMFGVGNAPTLAIAESCLALFGIGWGLFDGNNMPILSQIVRPELRATGYGIMNMVSIGTGGLADWWFGEMRDRHLSLNVIFAAFSATIFVSILFVLLIRPRAELSKVMPT